MTVLLDSDVLIEILRQRNEELVGRWRRLAAHSELILCTPVSVCELWHGARPPETAVIQALFASLICPPIDMEIGRRAGAYLKQFAKSHSVDIADAMIAASAFRHDAALWTLNRKHYPMQDIKFY